jgi:predicted TIM-barrel fold metal-dependent hydrolase
MVAQAWLDAADAPRILEEQAAFAFVRSVRHKPRANAAPNDGTPGGTTNAKWRAGFSMLARLGLRFDLQTPWWHLARSGEARDRLSGHARHPQSHRAARRPQRRGPRRMEARDGGARDLSEREREDLGPRTARQPWTAAANGDIVRTVIDLFGVGRCMFASNFPVDSLCAPFATIFGGFREIVRDFPVEAQRALFRDNAIRHYAIP